MSKRLAVILIDRFADWEHGYATSVLQDYLGGEVRFYTPGAREVASEAGMRPRADGALEALTPQAFDGLAVIGSSGWFRDDAPDIGSLLRESVDAGRTVGLICGATLAGARAGLFDARPHTSNDLATLQKVPAYRGAAQYRDVPHAVRDGHLVSAAGFAPRSFAFELLTDLCPDKATELGFFRKELTAERFA